MSTIKQEPTLSVVTLQHLIDTGADATQIGLATGRIWRAIDGNLFAIVGQRGVSALYQRSILQTSSRFPWLADLYGGLQADMDLMALQILLGEQSDIQAAAASSALFLTFYERLAGMIGPILAERLLRTAGPDLAGGLAAKDLQA